MELRHLRYFIAVADEMSLGQAALKLHISQPAVSRQIQNLEEELGVSLFDRTTTGMQLTRAGGSALDQARVVVASANSLVASMQSFEQDSQQTVIRIGYIATALNQFLAGALRQLSERYPQVSPQIREMTPSEQEAELRAGNLDLALLGHPRPEVKQEYRVAILRKVPLAAVISSAHSMAHRKTITLEELIAFPFLSLDEKHFPTRNQMLAELFAGAKLKPPRIVTKAEGISELLGLVGANTGVAVLPEDAEQFTHTGVAFLKLRKPTYYLTTSAVWAKNSKKEAINALVELMQA